MIISHHHQIIFLHIPKCGGTSIRNVLRPLHDDDPIWDVVGWRPHPVLGRIAYGHLPLYALREHFPQLFQCLLNYHCFAIVRDPKIRFVSSLSEYTRVIKKKNTADLEPRHFVAAAGHVCNYLSQKEKISDHSYVHFERQVNYIKLDGQKVVGNLYEINDIQSMIRDISSFSGEKLQKEVGATVNRSEIINSGFVKYVADKLRPNLGALKEIMPPSIIRLIRSSIYTPIKSNDIWKSLPEDIKSFVLEYYDEDQGVYDDVNRNHEVSGDHAS